MLLFTYKWEAKSWKVEVGNRLGEKPTLDKRKLSFTRPHLTRPQIWHHVLNIGNTQSTYTHTENNKQAVWGRDKRKHCHRGTVTDTTTLFGNSKSYGLCV